MIQKTLLLALAVLATTATHAQTEMGDTSLVTRPVTDSLRFDEVYYLSPQGFQSNQHTELFDAGYRSVEIDVISRQNRDSLTRGPLVSRKDPGDFKCSGSQDHLADCLDDVMAWQDANAGEVPLMVFLDMNGSSWTADRLIEMDSFIGAYLSDRLYGYSELRSHVNDAPGTTARQKLKNRGWPTVGTLRDKIIVAVTSGESGSVNKRFSEASDQLALNRNMFMCPKIDVDKPDQISGKLDDMTEQSSGNFICTSMFWGKHYQVSANRASEYRQLLHMPNRDKYEDARFDSRDFGRHYFRLYLAVAHGVSAVGFHSTVGNSEHIFRVGERRSLPGYFSLRTKSSDGVLCIGLEEGKKLKKKTLLKQQKCTGADTQQFVYTAENQLRLKADNKFCVVPLFVNQGLDYGKYRIGMHNCKGKSIESWGIRKSGGFYNQADWGRIGLPNVAVYENSSDEGANVGLYGGESASLFFFDPVNDWEQEKF